MESDNLEKKIENIIYKINSIIDNINLLNPKKAQYGNLKIEIENFIDIKKLSVIEFRYILNSVSEYYKMQYNPKTHRNIYETDIQYDATHNIYYFIIKWGVASYINYDKKEKV